MNKSLSWIIAEGNGARFRHTLSDLCDTSVGLGVLIECSTPYRTRGVRRTWSGALGGALR